MLDKEKILNFLSEKWKPHHRKALVDQFENGMFWALKETWEDIKVGNFDIPESKETCKRSYDFEYPERNFYSTECGDWYYTNNERNDYIYCPCCGKPIEELRN